MKVLLLAYLVSSIPSIATEAKELLTVNTESGLDDTDINACSGLDVLSCTLVNVNFEAFEDDEISLPGGRVLTKLDQADETGGNITKTVTFVDAKGSEATFTFKDGRAIGNVAFHDGTDFVLEDCNNFPGCHIWKEEDESDFEDEVHEAVELPAEEMRSLNRRSTDLGKTKL